MSRKDAEMAAIFREVLAENGQEVTPERAKQLYKETVEFVKVAKRTPLMDLIEFQEQNVDDPDTELFVKLMLTAKDI